MISVTAFIFLKFLTRSSHVQEESLASKPRSLHNQRTFMAINLLFYGSWKGDIEVLKPRQLFFPDTETTSPAVYATDSQAYAVGRAFAWSARQDVELGFEENRFVLKVPQILEEQLRKPIFLYAVPSDKFQVIEKSEHDFRATEPVQCLARAWFPTVIDAVVFTGGIVIVKSLQLP